MKKILVIEDDRKIALALAVRLKARGYQVLVAGDALAGVGMAFKHEPDLVILDIAMPAGDGFSVAERIQGHATTVGTPTIIITAGRVPAWREKARELGAVAYFEKPFRASDLLAAVEQALGETTARPPAPSPVTPEPTPSSRY
jgi:DNA-binding response OmpR family regulator